MAEPPSSPPSEFHSIDDAAAWYKAQYEQLELELQDFRASSGELEAELEKDLEEKERVETQLRGKCETLEFEVDEWKVCAPHSTWGTAVRVRAEADKSPFTGEIQAIQNRGNRRPKQPREGNHNVTRV